MTRLMMVLLGLIAVALIVELPVQLEAQTGVTVAPPVPGPYRAVPTPRQANPYSNPGRSQNIPYWMRPQGPGSAHAARPVPQNYIPGWVWSPYAPNGPAPGPAQGWTGGPRPVGQGGTPTNQPPGYGMAPWGQPRFAPHGQWPAPQYGAPPWFGAPIQPNR